MVAVDDVECLIGGRTFGWTFGVLRDVLRRSADGCDESTCTTFYFNCSLNYKSTCNLATLTHSPKLIEYNENKLVHVLCKSITQRAIGPNYDMPSSPRLGRLSDAQQTMSISEGIWDYGSVLIQSMPHLQFCVLSSIHDICSQHTSQLFSSTARNDTSCNLQLPGLVDSASF